MPKVVVSFSLAISFSCPSSVTVRDIDGLSSLVFTDLGAIFWIGPQGQANLVSVVPLYSLW